MTTFTNVTGVPLSVAVYLATDNYDYDPSKISVTSLIRPLKQSILSRRVPKELNYTDVLSVVKSRTGSAIHDSIERAWKENYKVAMQRLDYPQETINKILINPEPEDLKPDSIPVYLEIRKDKVVDGVTVTGKFDFVAEGRIEDFKSTTVYSWISGNKTDDFKLQGSMYRWLNPEIITQDTMAIEFVFTDWMPGRAAAEAKYPKRPVEQLLIPLLSIEETDAYIRDRINTFKKLIDKPQDQLPPCTDKDLWRTQAQYKYYKNKEKRARSTKNFDNLADAQQRLMADGNVGIVVTVPGKVIACKYCNAFPICEQKDSLIADGSLILE